MARVAKTVYAKALFAVAEERGETDSLMEELLTLREALAQNDAFLKVMTHPQIAEEERQALLDTTFDGRISDTLLDFFRLLIKKNRFGEWAAIADAYEALWYEKKNIGVAHIASAMELSAAQKEKIESRLRETTAFAEVRTEYTVDPSLIGGIVVRIGDRVADGSIRRKLAQLTKTLEDVRLPRAASAQEECV